MKAKYYLAIVGLVLLIVAVTASRCGSPEPKSEDLEVPPSLSGLVDKAPIVSFCELINKPEQYNNKVVRTEAILYSDRENGALYSSECNDTKKDTWADFDASYDYSEESVKKKFKEVLCPRAPCPSGKAKVTVVGRFEGPNQEGYGHLNGYRFRIVIMRIVTAEKVP